MSVKDRITAGMYKLDAWRPGWHKDIDRGGLNIGSPTMCVCGQLERFVRAEELTKNVQGWRKVLDVLGIGNAEASDYGFAGLGFYDSYGELTREWATAIDERIALEENIEEALAGVDFYVVELEEGVRTEELVSVG